MLVWAAESGYGQDIAITQQDVRQLQLAKGAIYSGILMLKKVMVVPDELLLAASVELTPSLRIVPS